MAFSFFFRDHFILDRFSEVISKEAIGRKEVKIWDAGCALGQEPYTFAILLAEKVGYFTFKRVKIFATDIDETGEFEKTITKGIYSFQDLSRIPEEVLKKYFVKIDEGNYQIVEEIRSRVKFFKHNLLTYQPIDIGFLGIICKNVLLHFSYLERIQVLEMFYHSLTEDGFLALEQTQKITNELESKFLRVFHDVTIYQKI